MWCDYKLNAKSAFQCCFSFHPRLAECRWKHKYGKVMDMANNRQINRLTGTSTYLAAAFTFREGGGVQQQQKKEEERKKNDTQVQLGRSGFQQITACLSELWKKQLSALCFREQKQGYSLWKRGLKRRMSLHRIWRAWTRCRLKPRRTAGRGERRGFTFKFGKTFYLANVLPHWLVRTITSC